MSRLRKRVSSLLSFLKLIDQQKKTTERKKKTIIENRIHRVETIKKKEEKPFFPSFSSFSLALYTQLSLFPLARYTLSLIITKTQTARTLHKKGTRSSCKSRRQLLYCTWRSIKLSHSPAAPRPRKRGRRQQTSA